MREVLQRAFYSLPVQLLFHHLKKNLPLVAVWIFFLLAVFGKIGSVYGIHYLFLDPEYLHQVGFWSFFMVGLAFANFTVAFFITSYILDSHQFAFVGILEKPFLKFSVNNSLIPLFVLIIYLSQVVAFHSANPATTAWDIALCLLGFISGLLMLILVIMAYFRLTNKDIFKYLAGSVDKRLRKSKLSRDRMMNKWKESTQSKHMVRSYFDLKLRNHSCLHLHNFYDREAILKVFDQNHFNSVVLELVIIVIVLTLGIFVEKPAFQIPAAASVLLLFSIIIMMVGAITYWFKGWSIAFVAGLFVIANMLVEQGMTKGIHKAAGMNYDVAVEYSLDKIYASNSGDQYRQDQAHMLQVLENWKDKHQQEKPKIVFQCVSGGGQRAALWTFLAMQSADSILQGQLMDHIFMVSGASGGMIGAAYYRELYRRMSSLEHLQDANWVTQLGRDNLNPIIFSLVVNDTFFRLGTYTYKGQKYRRDRGYVFEKSLNQNLAFVFSGSISDYERDEYEANIPLLLLSPTIANDGRKLYISSQPVSFMNHDPFNTGNRQDQMRGIDFQQYFNQADAGELSLLTALRMSASFPYITPITSLPSEPRIEIMDAGISDNFGVTDALRFMYVFREWIRENTSGAVLLVMRDTDRVEEPEERPHASIINRVASPISSVYNNLAEMQDLNNDRQIRMADAWLQHPFDVVEIAYGSTGSGDIRASLSWHLTSREKQAILRAKQLPRNQLALQKLNELLLSDSTEQRPVVTTGDLH